MHLSLTTIAVGAIILIVVIVLIVHVQMLRMRKHHHHHEQSHSHEHGHSDSTPSCEASKKGVLASAPAPERVEVKNTNQSPKTEFPRHHAEANKPAVSAKSVTFDRVEVESAKDLFSAPDGVLAELGMTKEELDAELEKYEKKRTFRQRKIPVNKNFDMDDYKNARAYTRKSVESQKVLGPHTEESVDRKALLKRALARKDKIEREFGAVDVIANGASDKSVPTARGPLGKIVNKA